MGRKSGGTSKDELAKLVRQGKDLEAGDRARREQVDAGEAIEKTTEETMRLYASVSPFVRWRWFGFGILLGAAILFVVFMTREPVPDEESDVAGLLGICAACVPLVALYFVRPYFGPGAVARETAWMESLPFRLVGYLDALRDSSTEGTASLTITFARSSGRSAAAADGQGAAFRESGNAPETAMIADDNLAAIFRTIGGRLDTSPGPRVKKVLYSADFGDGSTNNNSHLADFVHQAVALLETIHAEHPIEDVRVKGF